MKRRVAKPEEIGIMLGWAAKEGWNPGLGDAEVFHRSDPAGFFVAEVDAEVVAAISVVNHSADMAFLGLYLCRPDFRGQGIGYALWHHALAHADHRTVGLDGVADQQANYAKSGFVRAGSTIRFEGTLTAESDLRVRAATPRDLPGLIDLDEIANGYARRNFLNGWLSAADSRRTVILETASVCTGFATVRKCQSGVKVGPIVADTTSEALVLARGAIAEFPSDIAIIDVPAENVALCDALQALGFDETFATARMYRGPAPRTGSNRQAIATMELG
ncbi:GNAT family N-acetyltransferase [Sedimentitalea todarodis]|uniref:GNAT family N-acetyltransferase n=1 Tax=Sedimentitalea todarodis TaxID=1631240 RepID=A0ABU3VBQ9_9RHOB|nr:GNAT family N-acetyltransferase [Sedimentitalea todarodis]MDU9003623.1 GNAT family N-acetyltransferase [Sedimentitalea todarodis]